MTLSLLLALLSADGEEVLGRFIMGAMTGLAAYGIISLVDFLRRGNTDNHKKWVNPDEEELLETAPTSSPTQQDTPPGDDNVGCWIAGVLLAILNIFAIIIAISES